MTGGRDLNGGVQHRAAESAHFPALAGLGAGGGSDRNDGRFMLRAGNSHTRSIVIDLRKADRGADGLQIVCPVPGASHLAVIHARAGTPRGVKGIAGIAQQPDVVIPLRIGVSGVIVAVQHSGGIFSVIVRAEAVSGIEYVRRGKQEHPVFRCIPVVFLVSGLASERHQAAIVERGRKDLRLLLRGECGVEEIFVQKRTDVADDVIRGVARLFFVAPGVPVPVVLLRVIRIGDPDMDILVNELLHDAFAHRKAALRIEDAPQQRLEEIVGNVFFGLPVRIVMIVIRIFLYRNVPGGFGEEMHIFDLCPVFMFAHDHIGIIDVHFRLIIPVVKIRRAAVLRCIRQTLVQQRDGIGVGDPALRIGAEVKVVARMQQRVPRAVVNDLGHAHHGADAVAAVSVIGMGMRNAFAFFIHQARAPVVEVSAHRAQQPARGLPVAEDLQPLRLCVVGTAKRPCGVGGVAVGGKTGRVV